MKDVTILMGLPLLGGLLTFILVMGILSGENPKTSPRLTSQSTEVPGLRIVTDTQTNDEYLVNYNGGILRLE